MLRHLYTRFLALAIACSLAPAALAQSPWAGASCSTWEGGGNEAGGGTPKLWFPARGQVNALIVFVQEDGDEREHCGDRANRDEHLMPRDVSEDYAATCAVDTGRYESWSDDPETEWPHGQLPAWAETLIDPPHATPEEYTEGSLSDYYWTMSGGRYRPGGGLFRLQGAVYPELVVTERPIAEYARPYHAVTLADYHAVSQEVIRRMDAEPHGIDYGLYDRYPNGWGGSWSGVPAPDGRLDMLVIVHRRGSAAIMNFGSCWEGNPTPWGCDTSDGGAGSDAFPEPLYLHFDRGGVRDSVRVQDNDRFGSGVLVSTGSRPHTVSLIAHEIGHRQFGPSHELSNSFGVMAGHDWVGMAATDRYRLDWITPTVVSPPATAVEARALGDTYLTGDALCVSPAGDCRDESHVIVEARTYEAYWNGGRYDVDGDWLDDVFGGEEGLMVYRRGPAGVGSYISMERTGLPVKSHRRSAVFGVPGARFTYTDGDDYTPFTRMYWGAATPLNCRLGLVGVQRIGPAFAFSLYGDFPRYGGTRTLRLAGLSVNTVAGTAERTIGGQFRFEGIDDVIDTPGPLTLLPGAKVVVAGGGNLSIHGEPANEREPEQRFQVVAGAGAGLLVEGSALLTDLVDFRAANAAGWHGLQFHDNAYERAGGDERDGGARGWDHGDRPRRRHGLRRSGRPRQRRCERDGGDRRRARGGGGGRGHPHGRIADLR